MLVPVARRFRSLDVLMDFAAECCLSRAGQLLFTILAEAFVTTFSSMLGGKSIGLCADAATLLLCCAILALRRTGL